MARVERDKKGHYLPGNSGNPKGRPPAGYTLADLIREYLDKPKDETLTESKTRKQALIERLYAVAFCEQPMAISAAKLLLAYAIGMPKQQIEFGHGPDPGQAAFNRLLEQHPKLAKDYQRFLADEMAKEEGYGHNGDN